MAQKRDGLYKRGPVWWIRTDPVTGKAQSTYCRDLEAARRYRAVRERLAADPSHAAAETARLDEWIRRVIAVKESDGSSKSTVEVYRTKLGHWLRLAPGAMLADITPDFVDAFVAQRRTEEVTDHTISKEVTHLCTVLKAAKRAGCYSLAIETLRPPGLHAGYKPRKRALTREEVVALMAELKPELAALVAICVSLGCRLSEAYRLRPADIGAASVHIRGTKTDEADRHVPILSIFKTLLAVGSRRLPLGSEPNNLRRDIAAACVRAGIAVCTPNDLRRTHATLLAEAGVDRDVTRRLLGHTTTRLVDTVYGQPTTEALGALAEAKLLTATPLQQSPRHVAPEREKQNGHSRFRLGNQGVEGGRQGMPGRVEREGDVAEPANARRELEDDVALHLHEDGGRQTGAMARESDGRLVRGLGDRKPLALSQGRDTHPEGDSRLNANPAGITGADYVVRTRDLRFTKPQSGSPETRLSVLSRRYPGLSRGELLRSGAVDDTPTRQRVTLADLAGVAL